MNADMLKELVKRELKEVTDPRISTQLRELLVEPRSVLRHWSYGAPGEQMACWDVLRDDESNTGIVYCETGFGPRCPWGLVWLRKAGELTSPMGMDCAWFRSFLDAYFDSFAPTRLPIWRVVRKNARGTKEIITAEADWEVTWERVAELRKIDPASKYDCQHEIAYGSEL